MTVRRFYYVRGPKGSLTHMSFRITDGYRTHCGIALVPGWKWARTRTAKEKAKRHVCSRCLAAWFDGRATRKRPTKRGRRA